MVKGIPRRMQISIFTWKNRIYLIPSHTNDGKTFKNQQSVRYDDGTLVHEPLRYF